jgi:hypothetical protein
MAVANQLLAALAIDLYENSSDSDSSDEERLPRMPFSIYEVSTRLLFQRTRLDRRVFNYVLTVISPFLTKNTRKGRYTHLTPMHKLYVTLQFYATRWLVGSSGRISQSATSHAIREVTDALVAVAPHFIRFPTAEEYPAVKEAFYRLCLTR